jgi:DNA-binding MarR family transcriptional regulator
MLEDYLSLLGFNSEEASLYLSLVKSGPVTLLAASKASGIERTRLYRLVDTLKEKGLIEEIPRDRHRSIQAASISTLEMKVKEAKFKSQVLSKSFPSFMRSLQTLIPITPSNNVVFYHGREGIRQMAWHLLRSVGLYRTYSYRFWDELLGSKFTLDLNQEMVKAKLKVHDLFSDQYFEYKKEWLRIHGAKPPGDWSWWKSKYISEKTLKIDQNIDIYNNVVAYYHWQGNETFGVEIYNQRVADFHKQMHDIVWKMAKYVPDIDWTKPTW